MRPTCITRVVGWSVKPSKPSSNLTVVNLGLKPRYNHESERWPELATRAVTHLTNRRGQTTDSSYHRFIKRAHGRRSSNCWISEVESIFRPKPRFAIC